MKLKLTHLVKNFRRGGLADLIADIAGAMPDMEHSIAACYDDVESMMDKDADLYAQSKGVDVKHYALDEFRPTGHLTVCYDTILPPTLDVKHISVAYHDTPVFGVTDLILDEMVDTHRLLADRSRKTSRIFREYCIGMFMGQTDYNEAAAVNFVRTRPQSFKLYMSVLDMHSKPVIDVFKPAIEARDIMPCGMSAGGIRRYLEQVDAVVSIKQPGDEYTRCELETMATGIPLIRTETLSDAYTMIEKCGSDDAFVRNLVIGNMRISKEYDIRFRIVKLKEALKRAVQ